MAIITQNHSLNIVPGVSVPVVVHVSQGDTGVQLEFTLLNGSTVFDPTGKAIAAHGIREDGAGWGPIECTKVNGKIRFTLPAAATALKGSGMAEVTIANGSQIVGTTNFAILVEEATFPNGVTYSNDVSVYEQILAYTQSAYGSLNARVDQIIAPSGEAPNPAEILDARIGVNNVTYPNLGTAIRTQIGDLKSAISQEAFNDLIYTNGGFTSGFVNTDGTTSTSTIFSKTDFIQIDYEKYYHLIKTDGNPSGTIFFTYYDSAKNFVSQSIVNLNVVDYLIKVNNSSISYVVICVSNATSKVVQFNIIASTLSKLDQMFANNTFFSNGDYSAEILEYFIHGTYSGNTLLNMNYRVSSANQIHLEKGGIIKAKTGFLVKVVRYENSSWVDSEWLSTDFINDGCTFLLSIKREPDNTSEFADVTEFLSNISFTPYSVVKKDTFNRDLYGKLLLSDTCDIDWTYGTLSAGTLIVSGYRKRISSRNIIKLNHNIKLSIADGYLFKVTLYEGNTYKNETNYASSDVIIESKYGFRVSILKYPETSADADFDVFNNAIYGEPIYNVDSIVNSLKTRNFYLDFGYIAGLLQNNGTVSSSDIYKTTNGFIPLKKGETIMLKQDQASSSTGTCYVCLYDSNFDFVSYHVYELSQNYIVIPCLNDNVAYMKFSCSNNMANHYLTIKYMRDINTIINGYVTDYSYTGEHISFKKNGYNISRLYSIDKVINGTSQAQQGMAIFGNVMFVAFSQWGNLGDLNKVRLYDLTTGNTIATLDMTIGHGNTMQFSSEYYDASDEFPLLYVSGTAETGGYIYIYIYRVTRSSSTLIKTLRFTASESVHYLQGCVDGKNSILYTMSSPNGYIQPITFSQYDLSNLTENNDDTYTPLFIKSFTLPAMGLAWQGMKFFNGKIFFDMSSSNDNPDTEIFVVDPILECVVNDFKEFPQDVLKVELEDFDFVDMDYEYVIYMQGNNGMIYKMQFN